MLNYWPLVVALVCFAPTTATYAGDAHEGTISVREEFLPEPDGGGAAEPNEAIRDSGGVVGNLPNRAKKPDYNLKNLKPEDYPLEFLIPFMKTSQVFQKRVKAKALPSVTSTMDNEKELAEKKTKPASRQWTALPPGPQRAVRTIASDSAPQVSEEIHEEPKPAVEAPRLVSAHSAAVKPTKQLLDSFKASQ